MSPVSGDKNKMKVPLMQGVFLWGPTWTAKIGASVLSVTEFDSFTLTLPLGIVVPVTENNQE